jgi:hypothetical protein
MTGCPTKETKRMSETAAVNELTEAFVAKVAEPSHKRDDVARWYAQALRESWDVDYSAINHAILDRWSMAALRYIKERAWLLAGSVVGGSGEETNA